MPKKPTQKRTKKHPRKLAVTRLLPGTIVTRAAFSPDSVTIPFKNTGDLSHKLSRMWSHLAAQHAAMFRGSDAAIGDQILGPLRANVIVENCAKSTNLDLTLGQLMLDGQLFRTCVADHIRGAGFVPPDNIPASPDTKLIEVATCIEPSGRAN
jgi:hypothetical protein